MRIEKNVVLEWNRFVLGIVKIDRAPYNVHCSLNGELNFCMLVR